MRGLVERFCSNGNVDPDRVHDIKVAVTEAANNAAQHAYVGGPPGPVTLVAWLESEALLLELRDEGRGMAPRIDSPGAGLGIPMMGRLADQLYITAGPGGNGTIVRMRFGAHSAGGDRASLIRFRTPRAGGDSRKIVAWLLSAKNEWRGTRRCSARLTSEQRDGRSATLPAARASSTYA